MGRFALLVLDLVSLLAGGRIFGRLRITLGCFVVSCVEVLAYVVLVSCAPGGYRRPSRGSR